MSAAPAEKVVPAGTAIVGADGRVLLHTPRFADLLGRGGQDLSGQVLPPLLHGVFGDRFSAADPPAALHGQTADGRRVTLVVERLPDGRCCLSAADVTGATAASEALRRARHAAETASGAKSRVLATISHELRTPLNAVIGFADALAAVPPGGQPIPAEQVREYATTIREAGHVLMRQINNILDVVRLESGGIELSGDVIEVPRLIEVAVRQAETAARQAHVALAARPGTVGRWLRGDEKRLRQVLGHLIANALKFTPHNGSVAVETAMAENGDLLVVVRDSGIGVVGGEVDRIFDIFAEEAPDAPRRPPGAGFGLYFCRAILQAHGGQLSLASRPGAGTTVTLRLPAERMIEPTKASLLQETP